MEGQVSTTVAALAAHSQPLQLSQRPPVMVQQLDVPQSMEMNQTAVQQTLDVPVPFALSNEQQASVGPQVDFSINPTGMSALESQGLPSGASVFAAVPVTAMPAPALHSADIGSKLDSFWQEQMIKIQNVTDDHWKNPEFPLARIKKIMRMDEDVRMISAEVPVMFSKAVEIFIAELSMRAWQHTEESKRRTIQRSDIAMAITKNDMFDFLIDIVPREEIQLKTKPAKTGEGENLQLLPPDLLQMYIQQVATGAGGAEDGDNSVLQHQLQILQQLLQIQQLQEQQQQEQSSGGSLDEQQPGLITTPGAILEAQVLQASDNQSTDLLEQIRSQVSCPISTSELLNTSTPIQQPLVVPSSRSVSAAPLGSSAQYQVGSGGSEQMSIQRQLESLTHQVLNAVNPASDAGSFTLSVSDRPMVELPAEFGASVDDSQDTESEEGATPSTIATTRAPSSSDLVAFKSTPLRLTHVHGSSSLVELSNVSTAS